MTNGRHNPCAGGILDKDRRRWPNNKPSVDQRLSLAVGAGD